MLYYHAFLFKCRAWILWIFIAFIQNEKITYSALVKNSVVTSAMWLSFHWWFTKRSAIHKQQWGIPFPLSAELARLIPSFLQDVVLGSFTPLPVWKKQQKCGCLPRNGRLKLTPDKWLWKNCRKYPTTHILCGLSLPSPPHISCVRIIVYTLT